MLQVLNIAVPILSAPALMYPALGLHVPVYGSGVPTGAHDNPRGTSKSPYVISRTPDVSAMHHDETPDLSIVAEKLAENLKIADTSLETRKMVVEICNIVTSRSAPLAAARIVGIIRKIGRGMPGDKRKTVIAIDGGLFKHYAKFQQCLESTLVELLGEEASKSVAIKLANNGSGLGAALIAAAHCQYLK